MSDAATFRTRLVELSARGGCSRLQDRSLAQYEGLRPIPRPGLFHLAVHAEAAGGLFARKPFRQSNYRNFLYALSHDVA
jgi:hypothetical protein